MSIVVFDPDSTEDVDFKDRMRHPAAADPAGGMWLSDTEPSFIDADALRRGRLAKLRDWMSASGYGAIVLFDPYNQRYATGSRNMFGYFLRNSTRYFFVPARGPVVLFEYPQSYHVSMVLDTVDEARPSKLVWSAVSGRDDETAGPSVGGGGGNGGFAGTLSVAAGFGLGGKGGVAGKGVAVEGTYNGSVETLRERSAGIIVQSIGGGGGNGGGQFGLSVNASVGIGGGGAGGGEAGTAKFISTGGLTVTTHREDSAGVIVQSVGGGGGNGGFSLNGAGFVAAVSIGGKAGTASEGKAVTASIQSGVIHTIGDRSTGIIAQSIGGGGGNGGGTASAGLGANVTIGGKGGGGGAGGTVDLTNGATVHTEGVQSHGMLAQSIGGGGGLR